MGGDRRRGARARPKTYAHWLRCTLLANGVGLPLPRDQAVTIAGILVATGRAVPPHLFVEWVVARERAAAHGRLPHNTF